MTVTNNEEFLKRIARLAKQNQELEEHIKKLEKLNEKLTRENEKIKALNERFLLNCQRRLRRVRKKRDRLNSIWRQSCLLIFMDFQSLLTE